MTSLSSNDNCCGGNGGNTTSTTPTTPTTDPDVTKTFGVTQVMDCNCNKAILVSDMCNGETLKEIKELLSKSTANSDIELLPTGRVVIGSDDEPKYNLVEYLVTVLDNTTGETSSKLVIYDLDSTPTEEYTLQSGETLEAVIEDTEDYEYVSMFDNVEETKPVAPTETTIDALSSYALSEKIGDKVYGTIYIKTTMPAQKGVTFGEASIVGNLSSTQATGTNTVGDYEVYYDGVLDSTITPTHPNTGVNLTVPEGVSNVEIRIETDIPVVSNSIPQNPYALQFYGQMTKGLSSTYPQPFTDFFVMGILDSTNTATAPNTGKPTFFSTAEEIKIPVNSTSFPDQDHTKDRLVDLPVLWSSYDDAYPQGIKSITYNGEDVAVIRTMPDSIDTSVDGIRIADAFVLPAGEGELVITWDSTKSANQGSQPITFNRLGRMYSDTRDIATTVSCTPFLKQFKNDVPVKDLEIDGITEYTIKGKPSFKSACPTTVVVSNMPDLTPTNELLQGILDKPDIENDDYSFVILYDNVAT